MIGHDADRDLRLGPASPARAIDHVHALDRGDQLVDGIGQEADLSVTHDLGNGAARAGHHRRPARERLDHRQPERLGPVDREEQRQRISEQAPLLGVADLADRSEEHTSELQSRSDLVCRLLLEKKKKQKNTKYMTSYII